MPNRRIEALPADQFCDAFEVSTARPNSASSSPSEIPQVNQQTTEAVASGVSLAHAPKFNWQIVRLALGFLCILLAFSVHTVSEHPIQTPISEELGRHNPIAILLIIVMMLLIAEFSIAMLRAGERIQGWSLLPVMPVVLAIAFTSPESDLHLNLFMGVAGYGIAWLGLFSYLDGNRTVAFLCGLLCVVSVVFLIILTAIGLLFPFAALSLSPLGLLQKLLIVLFVLFACDKSL